MDEKFNIVKKGYDTAEVNAYIDTLEKVISSYKEKDNAIKNALINAQITADNIIKNAELEADKIVSNALKLMDDVSNSIDEQKMFVEGFQEAYNALIDKYVHTFNTSDIQKVFSSINELESYIAGVRESAPPVLTEGTDNTETSEIDLLKPGE